MCDECRARLEAEEFAGGAVLDTLAPASSDNYELLARTLAALDTPRTELRPQRTEVQFEQEVTGGGWRVVLDPENRVDEILEDNNRLVIN